MDEHGAERPSTSKSREDLRVYLSLGVPIVLITIMLATFIVTVQPMRGQ